MNTDAARHHLFSIIALLSFKRLVVLTQGLLKDPTPGPLANQRIKDSETAF